MRARERLLIAATLTACSTPPPTAPGPPEAQGAPAGSASRTPRTQKAARLETPVPPPLEDRSGIAGAPIDETAFEFEPLADVDDPAPVITGAGPVPPRVARRLAPYLEARRARVGGISSDGSRMLVLTRLGETTHAHLVSRPLGARKQVTFGPEPVQQASFIPGRTDSLLYRSDFGGHEDHQLFRLDLSTGLRTLLTDGRSRHGPFRWAPRGERLAFTGNARAGTDMDLYVHDGKNPHSAEVVGEREGQWAALGWSRSGRYLLARHYRSKIDSTIHLVDVTDHSSRPLALPEPGVSYKSAAFGPGDGVLYVTTTREGDFHRLYEHRLEGDRWEVVSGDVPWDVEEAVVSGDGTVVAFTTNENGVSVLRALHTRSRRVRTLPGVPGGVLGSLRFVGRRHQLAFTLTTATDPPDAYTYDIPTARLVRWTESEIGGLHPSRFVAPRLVRYASFDGLRIPAYYYRPQGDGPFPVLIWMHGGPEEQFRPGFEPIVQYFAASRGVAVLAPNVRGSDGYGARYLSLDDGRLREDAVKDVGALLDWIESRSELDAERVGIHGASYGGYMVLASLVEYGRRIKAGCNMVGISNFVSFLESTRGYRADLRRVEYGDERDPAMREYLHSISPLTHAGRIESALLVAHGANDPRVPLREAEAIVSAVRSHGHEVWFMIAQGEGHSFRSRRNRDTFYRLMAAFFEQHLLGPGGEDGDAASSPEAAGGGDAPVEPGETDHPADQP